MAIYKRGKTFYMDFTIQGQRVNKSTKQKTKTLALQVERKEKEKLEEQLLQRPLQDRMTLQEAVDGVWDEKWSKGRTGDQSYRSMEIIIEAMGNPYLQDVNSQWVRKLKSWLSKQKLTVATQNRYLAHLKTVLRYASRDEWEVIDKTPKISLGRETAKRRRVVTNEELDTMTNLLRNAPVTHGKLPYFSLMADFIEVLVGTGMRLSEGLSLEPKNLATEGQIELFPEQTKSSMPRTIPMTPKVQTTLSKLSKYPFQDLDMWKCQRCWKWIRKQMGIKDHDFCIHALRHSFASNLVNRGVDFYTVQKLLGHSSPSTTQRYAHMAVDTLVGAVGLVDRV